MKNKTKIIIICFCILLIISILCISSIAVNNETEWNIYDQIIPAGSILIFKDTISVSMFSINKNYTGLTFHCIKNGVIKNYTTINYGPNSSSANYGVTYSGSNLHDEVWRYDQGWWNVDYKTIYIDNDYQLNSSSTISKYLVTNVESGLPEPPPPPNPMYDGTNGFLNSTLQMLTTIISFITTNWVITVFTIGIFIISVTVGIIYRLNNKTTKR